MARIETIPGTKTIAARIVMAENSFETTLMELAGVSRKVAADMRLWMTKKKLTRLDLGIGRINVRHGAFLDRDVLERIAAEVAA